MRLTLFSILAMFILFGCDSDSAEVDDCPIVTEPVIINAVTVKFHDANSQPLNVCDGIVTISRDGYHEVFYGSSYINCESMYSLSGGYDFTSHNVLIEKAGYEFQEFENIVPVETKCGYETFELNVFLEEY